LHEEADLFLLAGDLTLTGYVEEAEVAAAELMQVEIPIVAVLGNHDYHQDRQQDIARVLGEAGVTVLEGTGAVLNIGSTRVGVAGVKGFGGGFPGACGTDFGEPEMKAFIRHTQNIARQLEGALALDADILVALLHYSPVESTLRGERLEIYPFLGSYLLGEAVDRAGAHLVLHGHAHAGIEGGVTPGGALVRNVALPVISQPYKVYNLDPSRKGDSSVVLRSAS
jgi:Icc-related predicted phosphoesterase